MYERLRVRVSRQNNDTKVVCQKTMINEVSNLSEPAFLNKILPEYPTKLLVYRCPGLED